MGQRTLLLITENKLNKTKAYHCQWGIGRVTLNHALVYLLDNYNFDNNHPIRKPKLTNITSEFKFKSNEKDLIECIKKHDNNNGGVHIVINRNEYNTITDGTLEIAYPTDYTNEKIINISFREWCEQEINKDCCTRTWQTGFLNMLENMKIKIEV